MQSVQDDFLSSIDDQGHMLLATGQSVNLPIRYYESSSFSANFPVGVEGLRKLLPSSHLHPIEVARQTSLLGVTAFDHRHTDLGAYRELSISVPVTYRHSDQVDAITGLYSYSLPVTTRLAYDVGVEFWAFPKILSTIELDASADQQRCEVWIDQEHLITLEVNRIPEAAEEDIDEAVLFTDDGTRLHYARVRVKGRYGRAASGGHARIVLGDHPIAARLKNAGVDSVAVAASCTADMQLLLWGEGLTLEY